MKIPKNYSAQKPDSTQAFEYAATVLAPFCPDLNGDSLRDALDAYYAHADARPIPTSLTRREAAEMLHCSVSTIARLLKDGMLDSFATSKRMVRVTAESVSRLIESSRNYRKEANK